MSYTVGEMAELLGVSTSTLRYYDKEGLLPFVERSPGGMRVFQDRDYELLKTIECLKRTGMRLKDIRAYVDMVTQGDETIEARRQLILQQREVILGKLAELQETLDMLEFKCWYYEMAKAAGTTAGLRDMPLEDIPEAHRIVYKKLKEILAI